MKSIGEVLQLSTAFLQDRKIDRPRRSAEELLSHVLKVKRMDLYLQFDKPVDEKELTLLREFLKRAAKGEPIQYVIGEVEFLNCRIQINNNVLIPRPETEILATIAIKKIKEMPHAGKILWDVCTGSGYLGIGIKKACPELVVSLSDISKEALAIAAQNAQINEAAVEIVEGDLLHPFVGKKADFVICNPPYISQSEYFALDSSVRDHEPKGALLGGDRGTEFYERLAKELPPYLNPKAKVFLEIGASQGKAVKEIFSKGLWTGLELHKDWSGQDRFFFLEKQ